MNKGLRIFLYIFLVLLLIGAGVVFFIAITGETEVVIDDPGKIISPEELVVPDEDKYKIKIDGDVVKMSPDVDIAAERRNHNNNDIIARLEVPDLFNVLVVRGTDLSYYLDHSIDKQSDVKGATFMDFRNNLNSNQINIYGHNSVEEKLDVPFRRLEKLLDKSFFDSHPYIILQYENGKRVYKVTAITEVYKSNNEHMKVDRTGNEYVSHMNTILKNNPINTRNMKIDANSKTIVLQTCSHHLKDAVYLIVGVSIDYVEQK